MAFFATIYLPAARPGEAEAANLRETECKLPEQGVPS